MVIVAGVVVTTLQGVGLLWYMHAAAVPVRWDMDLAIPAGVLVAINSLAMWLIEKGLRGMYAGRVKAAADLRNRLNYGKPRILAAERWLANEADRKIESPHVRIVEIRDDEREEILSRVNHPDYDPMVDPSQIPMRGGA